MDFVNSNPHRYQTRVINYNTNHFLVPHRRFFTEFRNKKPPEEGGFFMEKFNVYMWLENGGEHGL